MEYKTISGEAQAEFVEKKSRFIGYLSHVEDEAAAIAFIERIRALHRKATHNCYAYLLRDNNTARHSDDGEPSGTAGAPIYEVIRREGLLDVCCVVTRYFGGVLLGAPGLVRAYTNGAKIACDAARIKLMTRAARYRFTVDYSLYGRLAAVFAELDAKVTSEQFGSDVQLEAIIREENGERLTSRLIDVCRGKIKCELISVEEIDFAE